MRYAPASPPPPIPYEALVLHYRWQDWAAWAIADLEGRAVEHPAMAVLSWLLCNNSAPHHQYVRCLAFESSRNIVAIELTNSGAHDEARSSAYGHPPPLWTVDDLIVTRPEHGQILLESGIRAQTLHQLWSYTYDDLHNLTPSGTFARELGAELLQNGPLTRNFIRI